MPKITAWQCPRTRKLFADQNEYKNHLQALARVRLSKRRAVERENRFKQMMATMRAEVKSFAEIEQWYRDQDNARRFITGQKHRFNQDINVEEFRFTRFAFSDMRWSDQCSNSHSAPIGKSTNWGGREKDVPRGYPGWTGSLRYSFAGADGLFNHIWKDTGICTGSGGGSGGDCYRFGVTIWADDWQTMAVWQKLNQ